MRKLKPAIFVILCLTFIVPLFPQQEVYITLKEGVPAIGLALPNFIFQSSSAGAREAAAELYQVVSDDLTYSRIFSLLPKKYYEYIRPLDSARKSVV